MLPGRKDQPLAAQHRVAPGAPTRTGRGSRAMANAGADKPARIFRDYDQAALDRELNLRGRGPEHGRFFERWARDSAAVRERLPARLDLAYANGRANDSQQVTTSPVLCRLM